MSPAADLKPVHRSEMLSLSTQHLSPATLVRLADMPFDPERWPWCGCHFPFGWVLYAADDRPHDLPDDLWVAFEFTRSQGCAWVRFDRDDFPNDDLPILSTPLSSKPRSATEWRVTWSIDVPAKSAKDAALQAWDCLHREETTATVFDVARRETPEARVQIDLLDHLTQINAQRKQAR